MLKKEKAAIAKRFQVEDLGEIHHVLGTVTRNRRLRTLPISQKTYLQGVLKRFEMENCKIVSTPLEFGKKYEALSKEEKSVDVKTTYQMAIGCLNYATLISRPDLAVAVGVLSKFMANRGLEHWKGVKRVFRHIQETLNYGLLYTSDGSDPVLRGYSDADWGW